MDSFIVDELVIVYVYLFCISLGVDLLVANATRILKSLTKLKEAEWEKWKETYFGDKTESFDVNSWQMLIKNLSFPWQSLVRKVG